MEMCFMLAKRFSPAGSEGRENWVFVEFLKIQAFALTLRYEGVW